MDDRALATLQLPQWFSSYEIEIARATGIAQKNACFVLQRLRFVLKDIKPAIMGATATPVEMEETFIGGKPKNMHRSKRLKQRIGMNGYAEKTAVFGMLECGTRQVRAGVIPNVSARRHRKRFWSRWDLVRASKRMAGPDMMA